MSDTIIVALIGVIGTVVTIISSFKISKDSQKQERELININAEKERRQEMVKTKQQNYHNFIDAFIGKMTYLNNIQNMPSDINTKFCLEFNRLPFYASIDVINKANIFSNYPTLDNANALFNAIRKDLSKGEYEFEPFDSFNFQCANK